MKNDRPDRFDTPPPPAGDVDLSDPAVRRKFLPKIGQPDDPGPPIEWNNMAHGGAIRPAKDYRRQSRRLVLKAITWTALVGSLAGIAYAYFQ